MEGPWNEYRWRVWAGRALAGSAALVVVLLAALWLIQDHLKEPILRYVAGQSQRQIRVDGRFQAFLFSLHPRIVADGVTVGNPPWMPPGKTAEIGHLELTYDLIPDFRLRAIVMERATLYLARRENGYSNWQYLPPGSGPGTGPPLIHSLRMPNARVFFDDAPRRLKFDGTISARDLSQRAAAAPLRIEGTGQLNGRATRFALNCDPLAMVSRSHPYRFDFQETSSGTLLTGQGEIPKPFDFHYVGLTFESTGLDMKDLYFLTGLSLPETGQYHLNGRFDRQDRHLEFNDLQARSGQSDLQGKIVVDIRQIGTPSHTHADLRSKLLRMSDLGAQAAGRAPASDNKGRLLPDTPLQLQGARRSIAEFEFHADTLEVGHTPVRDFATRVKINLGTIEASLVSGMVRDGKVSGGVMVDVTEDVPRADVDLRVAHMKLLTAPEGKPAPVEGALQGRIALRGRGRSLHDLAANATGTVTAVLPHGAMRSSLAELAGFDLRGLGLMATGNEDDTGIRCGVASFDVKDGTLTSRRLLLDTDPVLITGDGTIDLRSEALDLQLVGHPKHPRLRLRAPLRVRGTIRHPSLSIEAKQPMAQAGGAIALGVLLTPVAAMLAFVDPGLAKDSNCGALLAEVKQGAK